MQGCTVGHTLGLLGVLKGCGLGGAGKGGLLWKPLGPPARGHWGQQEHLPGTDLGDTCRAQQPLDMWSHSCCGLGYNDRNVPSSVQNKKAVDVLSR